MTIINTHYFFNEITSAKESEITYNTKGEALTLQIEGTGTGMNIQVLGCADMASDEFHVLYGLDTAYARSNAITKNGIYSYGIDGISKIKLLVTAMTGGKLTAFAKITTRS